MSARPKGGDATREQLHGPVNVQLPLAETLHLKWIELGAVSYDAGQPMPVSWQEILAYITISDYDFCQAEIMLLKDMSRAYAKFASDDNPLSISPMERAGID